MTALPHLTIGWANLQWPPTLTHTISAVDRTDNVYGQVWIDGVTSQPGRPGAARAARLRAGRLEPGRQRGLDVGRRRASNATSATTTSSSRRCCPRRWARTTTPTATRRPAAATGSTPTSTGSGNGYTPGAGRQPDRRTRAATRPRRRRRPGSTSSRPRRPAIELAWDAVAGDPSLYGYEVLRATRQAAVRALARVDGTGYTDTDVDQGATYYYAVRAVDTSFNRSRRLGAGGGDGASCAP